MSSHAALALNLCTAREIVNDRKAPQNAKQLTGYKTTPIQHELMHTSIPGYTLAEAVHIAAHILLVHIVAAAVDNIGLAA